VNQITSLVNSRIRFIPTADLEAADGWVHQIDRYNWYIEP
jgi:hypothetical protein